ncbi:hypothetical protein [Methylobacter sp. BlB1]|uniref:hypothetical protein n=1 Tax=Methylobacter sp. BlB1 TaxID=2785914 RepID=UPI001896286A|nr:hypothetical protein [Methylobacter sp. BlB1]MBF6650295.1 hypothetical protein [Methylobacter sp. BlB1]
MNFVYLLPFSYFARTRLAEGSLAFHALFEWAAALVLAAMFGIAGAWGSMLFALGAYYAFISLYEIGYLFNDLVTSKKESAPRLRGPQDAPLSWFAIWVVARLAVFIIITILLGMINRSDWWLFFSALLAVFSIHNLLQNKDSKASTFLWLAWFRFLAPVIFIVQPSQRMGIAFGAASLYAAFRLFGYLDSKGLLCMPGRQSLQFRVTYFLTPLLAAVATWNYNEAAGFRCMVLYFAFIASVAWVAQQAKARLELGG